MSEEEPRRFRGTADPSMIRANGGEIPGSSVSTNTGEIAGGLVRTDTVRVAKPRRSLLYTLVGVIAVSAIGVSALGFAIVSKQNSNAVADDGFEDIVETSEPLEEFPADTPAVAAGAGPCTTVTVLASFENAEMVQKLAKGYNDEPREVNGLCVTVNTIKDKSGVAATRAAVSFAELAPEQRPSVWLPDSSSWLSIATAKGATSIPAESTSVAQSAIVLAMPAPLAFAIGWFNEAPSWEKVFAATNHTHLWSDLGHPEWGSFKLGKTSPLVATSGEAALLASFGAAGKGVGTTTPADLVNPEIVADVKQHELATSHYMATPEHFLWHARQAEDSGGSAADFLSAVIVDEKSVWDYNRGMVSRDGVTSVQGQVPRDELVAIYPSDGVYVADNPAAVLNGDWLDENERAAAADFVRFTGTGEGQRIVTNAGYRDLHGRLAPSVQDIGILPRRIPGPMALPVQDVVAGLQDAFPHVRKRANVLFLLDVSGSMADPIPNGQSKLDAAKSAVITALDHFTPGDSVGFAAFSSSGDDNITPGLITPLGDVAQNRDALIAGVQSVQPVEFTPLYAAVDQFTKQQVSNYDPDRINAVVVLSDGQNETADGVMTEEAMLGYLSELHHRFPVLVFTLAYGAGADASALQRISSSTGAHFYDASDPTQVTAILGDLVTSF